MTKQVWQPGTLLKLSGSYWQAFALHAGVKLRVFTILSSGEMTAKAVSERLGGDADATGRLLDALCAMALLTKSRQCYDLSSSARRYLVEDSDEYVGYLILHHHYLSPSWTRLDESVRSGIPVRQRASHANESQREAFLMGMFNQAMQQAPDIAACIDLGGQNRLLDLGGGPGTYAIHFCLKYPQLNADVFDLPTTRPFAEKTIDRFGLSERVRFIAGDYLHDEFAGPYDAVWLSHILHALGPDQCRSLVAKAVRALSPGGSIFIHEFIMEDTGDGPLFPALFSLNMLLGTGEGRSYSQAELIEMLKAGGIVQIQRLPYKGPTESGIVRGMVGAG